LFLIDREGKVVANHLGYGDRSVDELVADINQALTGSPPEENAPAAPADSTPGASGWQPLRRMMSRPSRNRPHDCGVAPE